MKSVNEWIYEFKKKYTGTIAWRLNKHCEVINNYLDQDEEVLYAFCGQKNDNWCDVFTSCVIALTNKRLLIGQKRVIWGSFFTQITPDLYNDMQIYRGLFFGRITIDTAKEVIVITNVSKNALDEIETNISNFMMKEKKKYRAEEKEK